MAEVVGADIADRVTMTANSLRVIQIDYADHDPAQRASAIADEIERGLSQVVPAQRPQFMEALERYFPGFQGTPAGAVTALPAPSPLPEDWRILVQQLAKVARGLPTEERRQLTGALVRAGLSRESASSLPEEVVKALRERLKVGGEVQLDPARFVQLTDVLLEFALKMDELIWATWSEVAPRSPIQRQRDLSRDFRAFLSGDAEANRGQVQERVERLRSLAAAIIYATQSLPFLVNKWLQQRFSSSAIMEWARQNPGGGVFYLGGREKVAWGRFAELMEQTSSETIEAEVKSGLQRQVEQTVTK